jgi:predicted transcriptional regulator
MAERTIEELRALQDHFDEIERREDEEIDYTTSEVKERKFLVQRIGEDYEDASLMTASELINYIDMQDIVTETFEIYEVTNFGYVTPIHYVGWQPMCLIEFANAEGEIVLTGYGTDH